MIFETFTRFLKHKQMLGNLIKKLRTESYSTVVVMGISENKINLETGFEM